MSKAKHTPGPWTIKHREWRPSVNSASVVGADGSVVVRMPAKADRSIDQKQADLSLIAAAPDLLAALQYAVKCIVVSQEYLGGNPAYEQAEAAGKAAIRKATEGMA